jgi:hypothetical protein
MILAWDIHGGRGRAQPRNLAGFDEMSNLTNSEKRTLEKFLDMGSGYVLNFSDRTFAEFVADSTSRNIFDLRYNYKSGSKANRLRAFWTIEDNQVVASS